MGLPPKIFCWSRFSNPKFALLVSSIQYSKLRPVFSRAELPLFEKSLHHGHNGSVLPFCGKGIEHVMDGSSFFLSNDIKDRYL